MSLTSKCISDQTKNNYSGLVINTSHSLIGGITVINNGNTVIPYRITTDSNGNPIIEVVDTRTGTPNPPSIIYTSTKTKTFKKVCEDGFQSIPVSYSVTVNSLISQNDADVKALAKLEVEGPAYAVAYGTCQCSLNWIEPTISYQEGSAKIRLVIPNATEYRIGNEDWVTTNEFIVTQDDDYRLSARRGTGCLIERTITIRINPENDIFDIKLKELLCGVDTEDDPVINNIRLVLNSCDDIADRDIFNIKFIEEACSIEDSAEISDIKLVKAC